MFVLATIADTVRIPPTMLAQPTLISVHSEMDKKYPNRVVMDVGLVIGRYGDALQVGDGVCAAGDGGAHHEIIVRLIVFRPFVDEVCLGTISKSSAEGLHVSMGFFDDIFIPAYWMLRPSRFEKESGLWIWTPNYEDDDQEAPDDGVQQEGGKELLEESRFDMELGAEIRFKVKSINFTQVTNTAKGVQATTTTTAHSIRIPSGERSISVGSASDIMDNRPVRKRSTSIDLSDLHSVPASMHIVASICEDGLGLTSWWVTLGTEGDEAEAE
ncbi:RNA polymerase III subunit Rpc25 [Fragilaria crotonensis]|nr:RNA polymerase III subunit Rpc25 [Fragilaria crotonensis]